MLERFFGFEWDDATKSLKKMPHMPCWHGICGVHINSSIADEGGSNIKFPYKIEGRFLQV